MINDNGNKNNYNDNKNNYKYYKQGKHYYQAHPHPTVTINNFGRQTISKLKI